MSIFLWTPPPAMFVCHEAPLSLFPLDTVRPQHRQTASNINFIF